MKSAATDVRRHESESSWWEMVIGQPEPRLRPYVRVYEDYVGSSSVSSQETHVAMTDVPVIIGFGNPLRSLDARDPTAAGTYNRAFVAGLHDRPAITESVGESHGVQINFTAIGAYQFLGLPMHTITNRVVELDEIFGSMAGRLSAQLEKAPGSQARFDMLDAAIAARLAQGQPASERIAWACQRLHDTRGQTAIAALTDALGCSRRHLVAQFREQIGVPPKTLARILRFGRAVRMLEGDAAPAWIETALRCGYYDQAHFIRDFRQFSGSTPGQFAARRKREGTPLLVD